MTRGSMGACRLKDSVSGVARIDDSGSEEVAGWGGSGMMS